MTKRGSISSFILSVVLSLPSLVFAQDNQLRVIHDEALPVSQTAAPAEMVIPIPILLQQLNLKLFDAAYGELSICQFEAPCLYFAQQIKSWRCASNICDEGDGGTRSAQCFLDQFSTYSDKDQAKISQAICSIVKSPVKDSRMSLLDVVPDTSEHLLVENTAYLWAFKKNADQCMAFIKDYVGKFGPNWNFRWYRALSGCRILAQESTREKEEKDFHKWFSLVRGEGKCSEIKNKTLREACQAPGAASPVPGFEFLPGISQMDKVATQTTIDFLGLKTFQAAVDGKAICEDNEKCSDDLKVFDSYRCADRECAADKDPVHCFQGFAEDLSAEVRARFKDLMCPDIKFPSSETRQSIMKVVSSADEKGLVEMGAYLLAMKGSAKSCQDFIKGYVGQYGSAWSSRWYVALSGCRILARESTFEEEEKDFRVWLGVVIGANNCSGIKNIELRNACNTPGAASPNPFNFNEQQDVP